MSLLNPRDQGISLLVVPDLPLPPSSPCPHPTDWSRLVSPITPFSGLGRPVTIEEAVPLGDSYGTALLSFPNSEAEEFINTGLPGDGGSDGDMGGKAGLQKRT